MKRMTNIYDVIKDDFTIYRDNRMNRNKEKIKRIMLSEIELKKHILIKRLGKELLDKYTVDEVLNN